MSFTILEYDEKNTPGFLVESVVPDNVEAEDQKNDPEPGTKRSDINRIADLLSQSQSPNLVISVHGFNSPRKAAVHRFSDQISAVNKDDAITSDTVCIGFRWPSESMGKPWKTFWSASPYFLRFLMLLGTLSLLFFTLFGYLSSAFPMLGSYPGLRSTALTLAVLLLAIVGTLFLLRTIVYFRDGYRATQYGVPDLVDVIREIDEVLHQRNKSADNAIGLSFIGHSMGGYVVTNAVRILSDVFSPASLARDGGDQEIKKIGRKFHLQNLVLVSPDIPAEALMPNSANFLQSSLRRFEEAYLFSNEGDEVLRLISVSANYFSFPTEQRKFGYRLGNVGSVATNYGLTTKNNWSIKDLRIGFQTIASLSKDLNTDDTPEHPAYAFGYFDCTDCVNQEGNGVLTSASRGASFNRCWISHLKLLYRYLLGKPDVHSGYFDFDELACIIYRLASVGYLETDKASGGLSSLCDRLQIKALGR